MKKLFIEVTKKKCIQRRCLYLENLPRKYQKSADNLDIGEAMYFTKDTHLHRKE